MTPLLSFRDVGFGFGAGELFHGISFDVTPGSCMALIGPNGAGKTTLLRLAAGALRAGSGSILLQNEPIHTLPRRQVARTLALVPQQLEIPFAFTVREVVEQGRTPHRALLRGGARQLKLDREVVDHALEQVDVAGLQHRIFNELSGGERQRVKIALGLAQEPKLLLLDEPTQNLDIGRQVELIDLLHTLRNQGVTIVASVHDLHLVRDNFSSVLMLSPYSGLTHGTAAEMLEPALLEKAFDCPPRRHPLLVMQTNEQEKKAV